MKEINRKDMRVVQGAGGNFIKSAVITIFGILFPVTTQKDKDEK